MPKLLLSIIAIFILSIGLLQLRQQRLNLRFQINSLHDRIESSQSKLWNQQLKIAGRTTPEAMVRRVQQIAPAALAPAPNEVDVQPASTGPDSTDRRWLDSRVVP